MRGIIDVRYVERHAGCRLRCGGLLADSSIDALVRVAEDELGVDVSYAAIWNWLAAHGADGMPATIERADTLELLYGSELRVLKYVHAESLCDSLRRWTPPVNVSLRAAADWLGCSRCHPVL